MQLRQQPWRQDKGAQDPLPGWGLCGDLVSTGNSNAEIMDFCFLFFFFKKLILEKVEDRERGIDVCERYVDQLPLIHALTGD